MHRHGGFKDEARLGAGPRLLAEGRMMIMTAGLMLLGPTARQWLESQPFFVPNRSASLSNGAVEPTSNVEIGAWKRG